MCETLYTVHFTINNIYTAKLSIYVFVMGFIKNEKVFVGIFTFSSLFKIKMKLKIKNTAKHFCTHDTLYNNIYVFLFNFN